MRSSDLMDNSLSDRILIALHPAFNWLARCFPRTLGRPKEWPPHASAMLSQHNWMYRLIFPRFFKRITIDKAAIAELREASQGSTIVYWTKGIGQLEYHYFNHLFLEEGLPLASYTNALTLRRWMRWGPFWRLVVADEHRIKEGNLGLIKDDALLDLMANGFSVLISVPQADLLDDAMFFTGTSRLLELVVEAQRKSQRPIALVPLDFLWTKRPESASRSLIDILFGEKESPGRLRKIVLFWRNYKEDAQAVICRPIDLRAFLDGMKAEDNMKIASRLRGVLLSALKAKRRTITGPPLRPQRWFVQEVMGDDTLDEGICRMAAERGKPADDLRELAARYAREMAADLDYTYIEILDFILTRAFRRLYDSFQIDMEGLNKAKQLYALGPIVFVPNHKSHTDYLLLSYVLYHNGMTVPYIAAGLNLSFWPLGRILRRCGAYFIRRAFSGNELYRRVLEAYLKVLLREGYCQEFFIEGARSRTGKLARPRKGMLAMLGRAMKEGGVKDLPFIPVAITYDRVIEQKSFVEELKGGAKEKERAGHLLGLTRYLKKQRQRYGSLYIRFGEPQEASGDANDASAVEDMALRICHQINKNIVVTPTALASAGLMSHPKRGVTLAELKRNWDVLLGYLRSKCVSISDKILSSPDSVMEEALSQFAATRLIQIRPDASEPFVYIDEGRRVSLAYFKNGIVHFFVTPAVVAFLILGRKGVRYTQAEIIRDFEYVKGVLAHEFRFATRLAPEQHIVQARDFFLSVGAISDGEGFELQREGEWILNLFSGQIRPFIETLKIACQYASSLKEAQEERSIISGMMKEGEDSLLLGKVAFREAITKAGFDNALRALISYRALDIKPQDEVSKGRRIYMPPQSPDGGRILKETLERLA